MRLKTIKYLLLLVSLMMSLHAFAIEVDGIYYSVNSSTNEAEVTYKDANYNSYSGDVVIPDKFTYNGVEYPVTSIGPHAFQECTSLTSVSIPNSVTLFNDYAFYNCSGLTEVTIPNSVMEIGYRAFSFCSSLTSVAIPNSVTRIRSYAFLGCSSLTSVTIPNSVTNIGSYAFQNCNNLASIQITDLEAWCNITYTINPFTNPYHLYLNGEEIKDLVIPNSVTSIGNNAFFRCIGLTSVTIPNSVTSIGSEAFYKCSGLTSVTIPSSVTSIGESAFYGCSSLTEIYSKISEPFKTTGCWSDVNKTIPLYVPIGSKAKYQSTDGWKDFKNIIETEFAPTGVEVNATNFPDEAFRSWVLQNVSGASDGLLTDDEIAEVTSIDCSNKGIYSLQGIEFFTALTELNLYANRLASLNISKNSSLRKLHCQSNQLKTLELSKNMSLTRLDCNGNQLVTLELVNNTELTDLHCDDNKLTSLNVSKNNKLISLSCTNNLLFQLDLSTNNSLQIVRVSPQSLSLTAVDVTSGVAIPVPTDFDLEKVTNLKLADSTVNGSIASIGGQKYLVFAKLGASQSAIDGKDLTYTYNTGNSKAELMDVTVTLSYTAITPTGIEVNATNFPDEAFRNWVLQHVSGASDGVLTDDEIAKVKSIDCSGTSSNKGNISSLQGIEFFTALTNLDCSSNQLTGLDMSECTALTRLSCGWNLLTSLNVSKNTALTYLHCTSNQLTTLDVSNNTKLTSLSCGSNQLTSLDVSLNTTLTYLDCPVNQLPTLDVSNNTALTRFLCFGNQLTTLDVSNNTALTELWASSNQLKSLDVSTNTALTYLSCYSNQLTSLDLSKNTILTILSCYSNQLTSLDVSKNTALTTLSCYSNQLTSLDLSNNNSINSTSTNISSQTRSLTAVDVSTGIAIPVPSDFEISKVTNLKLNGTAASGSITSGNGQKYLVFAPKETAQSTIDGKRLTYTYSTGNSFSQAASMDVTVTLSYTPTTPTGIEVNATNFPDEAFRNWVLQYVSGANDGILTDEEIAKVTSIDCNMPNPKILDLTGIEYFTALTQLDCGYNRLTDLDISKNTGLLYLNCYANRLTALDVSKNTALTHLVCGNNLLTVLDISNNPALTILDCRDNKLTSFFTNDKALTELNCTYNQLTTLDVSKNTALTSLHCYNNQLTTLDVSKNTALTDLDCRDNQLTSLDVSGCMFLTELVCRNNQLTTLDASKNTALTDLDCRNNQLANLDVSNNTRLTLLYCSGNQLTNLDLSRITSLNSYSISIQFPKLTAESINEGIGIPVPTDFDYSNVAKLTLNGTTINGSITTVNGQKYLVFAQLGTAQNVIDGKELTYTYSTGYSLSNASMDVTVTLSYAATTYSLSIQSGSGGSVSYGETTITNKTQQFTVEEGTSATLTITPNTGYKLSKLMVNETDVTSSVKDNKYTISSVSGNTTVVATFEQIPITTYSLSIQSGAGGSVSYDGTTITNKTQSFTVNEGTSATITISPNTGYKLSKLTVNGTNVTSSVKDNKYTISSVSGNTTVVAAFEQITYTLSVQASGNGTVTYNSTATKNKTNTFTVNHGSSATLSIAPDSGYRLASLTVNGANVTSSVKDNQYTISSITANTTVVATFEQIPIFTYSLSIQSGAGGSVSYDGTTVTNKTQSFTVNEGTSATITISPNTGYKLSKLTVNGTDVTSSVKDNKYIISSISGNTTVVATFEQITYTLSVQATGNGTVTYNSTATKNKTNTFTVNHGSSATLIIAPDSGYRLASLTVNGTIVTSSVSNNQYTISNITTNTTVVATFEEIPVTTFSLSIQSGAGGSVAYNGTTITNKTQSFTVAEGASATITISPNSGYRLSRLTVNGANVTSSVSNNRYTINSISGNTTVVATFEQIPITTYSLSIQSGAGGSVSYDGTTVTNTTRSFTVNEGTSATITISPNSGYRLSKLTVNGTNVTSSVSNNQYTIRNITANTTVVATFEQIPATTYSLSIQSGAGGSVSYDGTTVTNTTQSFTVNEGTSATITITPNTGYRLSKLTVNGTNVTSSVSNNKYTINSITANTTVVVTFEQIPATTYSLSIQSGAGGSVSYDGTTITNKTQSFTVNEGTSATVTITPNTGYKLSKLTVNGTNVTTSVSNNKYTINSISANTTVVVTFEQITYSLSVQATGNGTVTYNSTATKNTTRSFTVNHGSSATLTISADNGYRLASLKVNGTNVTSSVSNNQYIISNITANTTVVATFEQIPATTYSLSIQSGAGGSVSYDGTTITNKTQSFTIAEGSSVTIEMTPSNGYKLASLVVNGTDVTSCVENNQYTISNITAITTVVVTFKAIPQTISVDGINYEVKSATDYTLNVGKGNYSGHVVIPATVSYDGDTWTVAGVVDGAFNLSAITAITWNPNTAIGSGAFGNLTNPNLLLYVKSEAYAPSNVQNVIANGRAKKIILTEAASGNDFNCPEAFTAEEISYSHRYGMTTGIGECRGWETIALPFDVKQFTHESKGTLIPFKVYSSTTAGKPFWLYRLTASGWQEAANIEANTPYIISLPNNRAYDNDYNLPGVMTFSSNNVTVPVTEAVRSTYGERTFVANFTSQSASWSIYALNVNNDLSSYSDYLPEGSTFIRELRTVHPFEAYMMNSSGNAKQFLPLFETLPTAIREIPMQAMRGMKGVRIYSMSGELIMFDQNISIEEALKQLKRGVYFVNGKKMVVK